MTDSFKYISFQDIVDLEISPSDCVDWAVSVIKQKKDCVLLAKDSIHFGNECFFNTMPSYIPKLNIFGVKEVSRITGRNPALQADLLLYDTVTGDLLCAMDATWITTMRTGAVASVAINTLEVPGNNSYSFVGLGNTARATLLCLNAIKKGTNFKVNLLKYKDQADLFTERFKDFANIEFKVYDNSDEFFSDARVVVSCVTAATELFTDEKLLQPGVLLVPVHTRGFQNCDLTFDQIFCDDISHISGFKLFSQYKKVTEMTDVLNSENFALGRQNDQERIIAYNIGISLQDVYFGYQILKMLNLEPAKSKTENKKFWV